MKKQVICVALLFGVTVSTAVHAGTLAGMFRDQSQPERTPPDVAADSFDDEHWERVDAAEARGFAEQLQEIVTTGDTAAFHALIDWGAVLDRATRNDPSLGLEPFKKDLIDKLQKGSGALTGNIFWTVEQGGTYDFLRVTERRGWLHVRFRLLAGADGLNYHDFLVARYKGSDVMVRGIYNFLSAEYVSETLRRSLIPFLAKRTESEEAFVKYVDEFSKMIGLTRSGRRKEAIEFYDQLPAGLRKHKTILFIALTAATAGGEEQYSEIVNVFRENYPRDVAVDMIALGSYFVSKDYDRARDCIDRIEHIVGRDPYLDVLRANMRIDQDDLEGARGLVRRALTAEPDLVDGWWSLIAISLRIKDFVKTAQLLTHLRNDLEVRLEGITMNPCYAEFVRSPAGAAWTKTRNEP